MREKTRIKQMLVLDLMRGNGGIASDAYTRAEVGKTQFYEWIKIYPVFKKDIENVYVSLIGYCTAQLYKKAVEGDIAALSRLKGISEWKLNQMKRDK